VATLNQKYAQRNMQWLGVVLMLVCAVCLCMGQFIWKKYLGLLPMLVGFMVYGMGALSMLIAYRFGKLSVLQPLNCIGYIISTVLGALFFGEQLTLLKLVGIIIIMVGVVLLTKGDSKSCH
jgi:undecaprenyl phosphate-alpha-L-ara4N flippase subunit ArnE